MGVVCRTRQNIELQDLFDIYLSVIDVFPAREYVVEP